MSDMLEKLLGVEKTAASLVSEAEAEAGRRTGQARLEAQKRHSDLLKKKAGENETALAAERVRLAAERESRNREERGKLSRLPSDPAAFRTAVRSFIDKGRE
jgi:regulator of protease activity HflC (stomatin/prohibitin superfamily)